MSLTRWALQVLGTLLYTGALSGCFVGIFNQNNLTDGASALSTSDTDTGGETDDSTSFCTVAGDTGNGKLDTCFNSSGLVPGYMRSSEYAGGFLTRQDNHSRAWTATDEDGNTYLLQRASTADHSYEDIQTPSYLCQINALGTQKFCVLLSAPGQPGNIPGAIHVSAEGDIYIALAQYNDGDEPGVALDSGPSAGDGDFQINLKVCRFTANPFSLDSTFGTSGCVEDATALSTDETQFGPAVMGPTSYEAPIFMDSRGWRPDGSFSLVVGSQNSTGAPVLVAYDEDGAPDTSHFTSWLLATTTLSLWAQTYSDGAGSPTADFSGGGAILLRLVGMNFQSMGKLVVFLLAQVPGSDPYPDFLVLRYHADGSRDTTFGTPNNDDGVLWPVKPTTDPRATLFELDLQTHNAKGIVDSEDRVLLLGTAFNGTNDGNFRVLAYNEEGSTLNHSTGNASVTANCSQGQKNNLEIIETPNAVPAEDKIFVSCTEIINPAASPYYQASIWGFDSTDLSQLSSFGVSGKLDLPAYDSGSLSLGLFGAISSLGISRKLVVFGTYKPPSWSSDDVPLLSRYSY